MYYYVWFQKEAPITHTKRGKAVPNTKKLFTHLKHEQTLTKGNDFLKLDKVVCTHICSILPFAQTEIHCRTLQFVGSNTVQSTIQNYFHCCSGFWFPVAEMKIHLYFCQTMRWPRPRVGISHLLEKWQYLKLLQAFVSEHHGVAFWMT